LARFQRAIDGLYELKLDGYRAITVKTAGNEMVYSRRGTDLTQRFSYVAAALAT
jgi:ATP-dependent DNA ligase